MTDKVRAPRNRTLTLSTVEKAQLESSLVHLEGPKPLLDLKNRVICQDMSLALPYIPPACVDLLVLDPPYNLNKIFGEVAFKQLDDDAYVQLADGWLAQLLPLLKPTSSIYVCGDWQTATLLYPTLKKYFIVRNRITWEREKGRGAKTNWKNSSEDIWFCTLSEQYTFNVEAVKLKRKVIAPYRTPDGQPKDWAEESDGNYRLTHPSNLWTDISIPFWSMPENTDHPTQKPEKLIAKLILASSNPGDLVFDPFLGSGTSAVVAQKLGREFIGIELDSTYACLALKRLALAQEDHSIQGYADGVFWERNSMAMPAKKKPDVTKEVLTTQNLTLFGES